MPWIVASQTVPIIALAPMIVVILNQFDIGGITPKAVIAAYLSFFPITVGMAKGFRSPDPLQLDLMRTYSATRSQVLTKLRAPASLPFFFASMKIGVAAALVGAVVAEVTKSEDGGLGARLLAGSYYGQTVQIWAALVHRRGAFRRAGRAHRPHRPRHAQTSGVPGMNARRCAISRRRCCLASACCCSGRRSCGLLGVPAGHPAPAVGDRAAGSRPPCRRSTADFIQTIRGVLAGYRDRQRGRADRRHPHRPLAVPATRPAAARQSRLGAADHRRRADHGDVVRLRLAVEGGGRRHHDVLPDAGERRRRA